MIDFIMQSSLEKIFVEQAAFKEEYTSASILQGEEFAFQIAYKETSLCWKSCKVTVKSDLKDFIKLYRVDNVPSLAPVYADRKDDGYITTHPGLFPDVLTELTSDDLFAYPLAWSSLWLEVKPPEDVRPGVHEIRLCFDNLEMNMHAEKVFSLEIIGLTLPKQELIVTQWFHCDGIAGMYGDKMFSARNWKTIENFITMAAENGINMMLTPIFTPPLDTKVGGERMTAQLVDIELSDGKYSFDFKKLDKWVDICRKAGIEYFEMAHLFTQWGAKCCPKIIAKVNGRKKRIFGWDTASDSPEYFRFLDAFLPALIRYLKEKGIAEKTVFHISDEPHKDYLETYKKVKAHAANYLKGFKIIDALSDFEFYKHGVIEHPVPCTNCIKPFLEADIQDLWTYYCCSQNVNVSNRFLAMPSQRNRIIGAELFKYDIKGFLHWGYNFYNSVQSVIPVNPYLVTDAMAAFPSGDAFSVYPGFDGKAVPSLRLKVFKHALQDISAMKLLSEYEGRDEVINLIDKNGAITFDNASTCTAEFVLDLREEINKRLKKYLKQKA